jgi:hypothetical protein
MIHELLHSLRWAGRLAGLAGHLPGWAGLLAVLGGC